jgi:hypothetical protein
VCSRLSGVTPPWEAREVPTNWVRRAWARDLEKWRALGRDGDSSICDVLQTSTPVHVRRSFQNSIGLAVVFSLRCK